MKRFQLSFVVALLMATVSAPAQRSPEVWGERNVRGGIASSRQHVGANQRGTRSLGTRSQVSRSARNREGARRSFGRHTSGRHTSGRYSSRHRTPVRRVPVHTHGYWRTVVEPVLVHAGYWHREHVPAVYGWAYDSCGLRIWGIVEPAHYHRVWVAPSYENRQRRIWVGY